MLVVTTRVVDVAMRASEPQGRRCELSGSERMVGRQYSEEEQSLREDEPVLRKWSRGRWPADKNRYIRQKRRDGRREWGT